MRWPILFLIGCRASNAGPSALVVTPQSVDGGALVTMPNLPSNEPPREGCPTDEAIADDAHRLAMALRARFGTEWETSIEDGRVAASAKVPFEGGPDTVDAAFEVVRATFPDLVLGEMRLDGHRMSIFHCRAELVRKDVDVVGRDGVCVELRGLVVDEIRVDRARRLPAFAPLLVHDEVAARTTAVGHASKVLQQHQPRADRVRLVAECDAARRATSLVWVVDVDTDEALDAISVDARTNRVIDAKVQRY